MGRGDGTAGLGLVWGTLGVLSLVESSRLGASAQTWALGGGELSGTRLALTSTLKQQYGGLVCLAEGETRLGWRRSRVFPKDEAAGVVQKDDGTVDCCS